MAAASEHELSERDFIGQVFSKASPVLTWRPKKVSDVARITPSLPAGARGSDAADRFSRAPTKRMVAWPVLPRVASSRAGARVRALRALSTLVGFSLLCGAALTICVYALLGEAPGLEHTKVASVRVGTAHVAEASFDTLLSAATAAALPAPTPPNQAAAPRHSAGTPGAVAAAPRAHTRRGPAPKWRRTARVASHGT